jgi:hypothetical protein
MGFAVKDYGALPMLMGEEEIAAATRELLAEARGEPHPDRGAVAEALVGMISRQSGLYRPFASELAADIETWVDEAWTTEPVRVFDALATVAVNLGTPRMRSRLKSAARHHDTEVRRIAEEVLAEM